ncbi:MAG: hypothetical protein LCH79_16090 [Proteobacteria bacterium]|nr:hypothetical protein [Pseudomonadota bacterium]
MALPELNPRAFDTLRTTAAARIARAVAQKIPSSSVRKIQQLLQVRDFAKGLLGGAAEVAQPLLGGMTLAQARDTYQQLASAQLARKNLFFIQIVDYNPPPVEYAPGSYFTSLFNLFALDVSYSASTLVGEKIPLGAAMLDRLTGKEAIELNITTMDDSRGSLKRWFAAKVEQAAHGDGTFGLPSESWIDVEIYHATPMAREDAYKQHVRMRPQSIQHEASRREQSLGELAMTFTEVDTFIRP